MLFDQYSRYRACADLLNAAGRQENCKLLDVGSGEACLLGRFLGKSSVTYLDPLLANRNTQDAAYIAGDIYSPELDGRQFEYVTCIDTFEHIPPASRPQFIEKISSLASVGMVLAFPCGDRGEAESADLAIANTYRQVWGREYSWLDEHIQYSLPHLNDVLGQLQERGWHCEVIGHGYAPWLKELLAFTVCAYEVPEARGLVESISEKFNNEFYVFDFNEPEYRQYIVATRMPREVPISVHRGNEITDEVQGRFEELMADAWHGLLEVLAQVSRDRDEKGRLQLDTQRKLMEQSDWGSIMQTKLKTADKLIAESNVKIKELEARAEALRDKVSEVEKQLADKQAELTKMSDCAEALRGKASEVEKRFSDKQAELMKRSDCAETLREKVSEAEKRLADKQAELMKMSDWARGRALELERLNKSRPVRAARKVKRIANGIRRRLSNSIVGAFVRSQRGRRVRRNNLKKYEALRQSVVSNQGRLIVTFPVITWDFRWQRPQHIVTRLRDRGFSVLYLAMSLTPRNGRYQGNWEAENDVHFDILDDQIYQIWLRSKKALNIYTDPVAGDDLFNISTGLSTALERAGAREIYYLIQFPGWSPVAFDLQRKFGGKIIFDCMDDHGGFSTNTAEALKNEERLIEQADLVITSSALLEDKAIKFNPNTILVKNGTDFDHFSQPKHNGELDHLIGKPIIGYYGAISEWFDLEIVRYCAEQRPDWNFVLIGATTGCDTGPVERMRNVHLLGEKPYQTLPGYVAYFDVCTIPFQIIPLTLATNPVKFYEYLSSGKPVVSVNLPELFPYQDNCYLARNKEEFLEQIQVALAEKDEPAYVQSRIELARQSSWCSRVDAIVSHPTWGR